MFCVLTARYEITYLIGYTNRSNVNLTSGNVFNVVFEECLDIEVIFMIVRFSVLVFAKRCGIRVYFLSNKLETISLSVRLDYPTFFF